MTLSRFALLLLSTLPACAGAQDIDPLLAGSDDDASGSSPWRIEADLLLRAESTRGFDLRDDIERLRSRLRAGWVYDDGALSARLLGKAALGSDSNRDNRRNLDNERSDALALDEASLRWQGESASLLVGKTSLPLVSSPLTWDGDLRPIGLSTRFGGAAGDFHRWSATVGAFAPDHLYGDDSRLAAMQLSGFFFEGGAFSAELHASWWHYDDLETARREGLMRSNRQVGGRLASDFHLINLQGSARWMLDGTPLALRLDLVRNSGADRERDGIRGELVYGSADLPQGWEYAVSWQRIQRDAVPAAFNEDDWWFHSAARGVMPWVAYGLDETWSVQLSGFFERPDGRDERITRVLLDVRARW